MADRIVLFVHGWSVTHTNAYGELPERLISEAKRDPSLALDVKHIYLGRYISFHDEVQVADIARAFEEAIRRELQSDLEKGKKFIAITHSTGGPVVRQWWDRYYVQRKRPGECPMSHLIMLAPANFGSALAQLGKGRVGRLQSWFEDVEPGTSVLDWLELGSPEAWELNLRWFDYANAIGTPNRVFPFVLAGQTIDRKFYDHLNSYTGETGSDGVVRAAAANLNASYVRLQQDMPLLDGTKKSADQAMSGLRRIEARRAPEIAFKLIPGRAHSGKDKGILQSVKDDDKPHPTVTAILECLRAADAKAYKEVCASFSAATRQVFADERYELEHIPILPDREYFHDQQSMIIVRICDDAGQQIPELELLLTGANDSPNLLPRGFLTDRQRNKRQRGTLTLFVNHDVMTGAPPVFDKENVKRRDELAGVKSLGLIVKPVLVGPFVHHVAASLKATAERLNLFLRPNETTMVDIVLRRIVRKGAFELDTDLKRAGFKEQPPGVPVVTEP
jgi:hypothetical protein